MSSPRFWHRVRFKLLLVSLTLLGIPWAGYRFIQETEHFLRDAQDQALQTTASSVANIMHGHEEVFHGVARPGSVVTFRNLFLHPLDKAPQLDGYRDEWAPYDNNFSVLQSVDDTLEARIFLGRHGRYMYLLLGVKDPQPEFGTQGDAVDLAFIDGTGVAQRYRIRPEAPGWVVARRLESGEESENPPANETAIRGEWQPYGQGYTLELRLPLELVGERLSVRIYDSHTRQVLASGRMFPAEAIGRIVERSAELDRVLESVTPPATRLWVTDHQGLVIARAGHLDADAPLSADQPQMPWFVQKLILAVLPRDADAVAELPDDQTHLLMPPVVDALSGRPASLRRQPPQGDAVVASAAVPIRSSDGVKGAILVEQTTNAILSIQNLALQRLFGVTLLFFAITSLGLLTFASLLASRITQLRNRVEAAVSHDGRIIGPLRPDRSKDEIGDLGRSFASVLDRLHQYNHYLEAMAARLAHELRTPLAVVRSSLDNAEQADPDDRAPYLQRARHGAERLEQILLRLREATGLEQALRQAEPVTFDLAALLRLQTGGFCGMYPDARLELDCSDTGIAMTGVPDLISQALDKLVGNAVDFHRPGSNITISCTRAADRVILTISNEGPLLPSDADIFQSMYSGREGRQEEPHLGLGLYLVRLIAEFHGGQVSATNREDPPGVSITLSLPRQT
jgi:dedicated sortase system histidine kinase